MNQFSTPLTIQARPSALKKKIALFAFIGGAGALSWSIWGNSDKEIGGYFFAVGLVTMAFAFRFWNMQIRNGTTAVTFDSTGTTIANRASSETILWTDLEAIRYKAWQGGHYWQFKSRSREETIDFYVDGLTSRQLDELREVVSSIQLPNVVIVPFHDPLGLQEAA